MASARKIVIQFLGDTSDLKKAMGDAQGATGKLSSGFKKTAVVAGAALGAGLAIAGKALYDGAKAAIADQQAQARLAKTMKNTAGASKEQIAGVEKWISAQGRSLGVTDDELRPAMEKLLTSTKDVGEAQKLASLAMDVSAGSGKSLESVSSALMKANNGNVSALSRLGINTKNAAGETISMEEATKRMADTFGGQAQSKANTLQGKMDRLKLIFDETKETIGAKLIPIVTKLADFFIKRVVPAIGDTWAWLKEKLSPAFEFLRDLAVKVWAKLQELFDGAKKSSGELEPFIRIVKAAFAGLGAVITKVLWPALKWLGEKLFPLVKTQITLVMKGLGLLSKAAIWLWNKAFQPAFSAIAKAIAWVIEKIADFVEGLSHIPGFGWAKDAADKLHTLADKANAASDAIKKIPDKKTVKVTLEYAEKGQLSHVPIADVSPTGGRRGGAQPARTGGAGARAQSTGDHTTVVQVMLDGKVLAESMVRYKRSLGRDLGLA